MYYLSMNQNLKVITNCPEQKAGQSCSGERRLLIFDTSKIFDSKQIFYISHDF